jgi:hypothetical protein
MALAVGGLLIATFALAQGHIPTRYAGSFPSDGIRTNITGTYTGKTLSLRFTALLRKGPLRRTFTGGCAATSANQTSCTGRIRGSGSDDINAPAVAVVTWSGGRPTALSISK